MLIGGKVAPDIAMEDIRRENIVRHETLGGLLKHYERKAA